jgi:HSP20 family protein
MAQADLVPWKWGALKRGESGDPFERAHREMEALHRQIDRLFDGWAGMEHFPSIRPAGEGGLAMVPKMDLAEDEKAFKITVDLPGMDEKDVDVTLTDRTLTIKGEKKEEREEKEKDYYRRERSYGSFRRSVELPGEVDAAKIAATFRKGVLTIDLPKSKEAQQKTKRIAVKS